MSGPISIHAEEPLTTNVDIDAVDESQSTLKLADFEVPTLSRYSLRWQRTDKNFRTGCVEAIEQLSALTHRPIACVLGWKNDVQGALKMRHKIMRSNLDRAGWSTTGLDGIGLAISAVSSGDLARTLELAQSLHLGWFVTLGEQYNEGQLTQPPLLKTMRFFCWNQRLAPSYQFLEALAGRDSIVAYAVSGDDRQPALIVLTADRLGTELSSLVAKDPLPR
jgi:hypothetical protein